MRCYFVKHGSLPNRSVHLGNFVEAHGPTPVLRVLARRQLPSYTEPQDLC